MMNWNPEQLARDHIDRQLIAAGWGIPPKSKINLNAGTGVAVREYTTSVGPADYVLFVDKKAVGIIEAKRCLSDSLQSFFEHKPVVFW
jgi:type I restriction enzyme R subunit